MAFDRAARAVGIRIIRSPKSCSPSLACYRSHMPMNMLRLFKQSLVASLLLCVSAASSANLLVNGSFEDPVVSTPLYFTNTPFSFSGWSGLAAANEFRRGDVGILPGSRFGLATALSYAVICFNLGH